MSLDILKEHQIAYENKMEIIDRKGGSNKLHMQMDTLRSWVSDLIAQNTLLVKAVEELELEAIRLVTDRRRLSEMACELQAEAVVLRRRLERKDSDVRGLVEVLRRLREFDSCTLDGIHFFDVTESDIFGSVEWRQNKLEQGDARRNDTKNLPSKRKNNRNYSNIL